MRKKANTKDGPKARKEKLFVFLKEKRKENHHERDLISRKKIVEGGRETGKDNLLS